MTREVTTTNTVTEKGDLKPGVNDEVKDLEINLEEIELPVPPDGGWSWAVLVGSFVCMFCVDGLSFSFGVLLSDLQTSFECTTTKISLASSLIVGFTLISGPIVSAVSNIFSFRSLVLVGSGMSFCSVLACAFVNDVNVFIVLFGFVTGTCYGMIYLPAATIVSQWFAKLRATATGISMCGSSIGTAVYSAILPKLLKVYSWRGCMAIMAAMSLHCFAAGCLFIPLRDYQRGHPVKKKTEAERQGEVEDASVGSKTGLSDARSKWLGTPNWGSVAESGYLKHMETVSWLSKACFNSQFLSKATDSGDMVRIQGAEKHQPPVVGLSTVNRVVGEVLSHQNHSRVQPSRRRTVSVEPSPGASVYVKHDHTGGNQLFASAVSLRPIADAGVHVNPSIRREIVRKLEREMDLPANRKDFFYSASMFHVNEYVSSSNVNDYIRSVTKIDTGETAEEGAVARPPNHVVKMLTELFDFGLLRSPTFLLLLASSVFGLLGYPVPYVFLSDEAQTLGFSAEASANLLVYLSSVNTVGRVMAGVISDWPCTDALFVNNAALIISGTACIVLPLMPSYIGHVAYAVTFGLAIAAFVSLRIILLVEMLGLERLTNAFGFLLLFQGLAFIVSPPLLASFYDLLKSYNYTFILGGASLVFSALLCFPLRPILFWERRRRGEVVPPNESGHCIRLVRRLRDRLAV
ncbi:Monocarboxylate transporter 1 [Taenia solium]|eukprot:TsM_000100900 transcript=TsM_000100900 gene=TsM_000100900